MNHPRLGILQQHFSESLFDPENHQVLDFIRGESASVKNLRMDIYRNNMFYSLRSALADLYPVVKKLTGDNYFNATASVYLHQNPPERAAMVYLGHTFPDFLKQFEHTQKLGWLIDVARLELAWHQSYHAQDNVPLTATELASIPISQLAQTRLALHPSVRLLQSEFPVSRIWAANQPDCSNDDTIDLDAGGEFLCVCRPEQEVMIIPESGETFIFLTALQQGKTLGEAVLDVQQINPDILPTEVFAHSLAAGLLIKPEEC